MLIMHTSDWHLGRTLHGEDLSDAFSAFGDWLLDVIEERGVDVLLVSGDVFDRAVPPVDHIQYLSHLLERLCSRVRVVMTAGNHDSATRLGAFSSMLREELRIVSSPDEIGTAVECPGTDGGVLIYPVPYLEPDLVRVSLSDLPEDSSGVRPPLPRSHEAVMAAALRRIRADLCDRRSAGDERPVCVMAHAFVTGAAPSDSERDIQVGGVPSVSAQLFDSLGSSDPTPSPALAYVALGHLHRPQDIAASHVPMRYSGSPLAFSFSEAGTPKSVTLIRCDRTGIDVEVLPIPTLHPLRILEGTMDEVLAAAPTTAPEDYVSVTITDSHRPDQMVPRIRAAFAHPLVIVHRPEHLPNMDVALSVAPTVSPLKVLEDFCEEVGGRPLSDDERAIVRSTYESVRGERA